MFDQNQLTELAKSIRAVDEAAMEQARARQAILTKPEGALGLLEELSVQLAGIAGQPIAPAPKQPAIAVFAGDHGVVAQGVTPHPSEVTVQMAANMAAGGAAVNVLARQMGARAYVVDVGVANPLPAEISVWPRRIADGTADFTTGPAMSREQALAAIGVGVEIAQEAIKDGADILCMGEMGIGNTTPSAALISVFTGENAAAVTGRGAGSDDAMVAHKAEVIARGIELNGATADDPLGALASVGGYEHAALVGYILAGAAAGRPVVIDGVIACSAALTAVAIAPNARGYLIAGHAGAEPGIQAATKHLELHPLIDLQLRLGEGTGALLALPLVRAAALTLAEMATFADAAVTDIKTQ
mgnify:CR=1 FL=1